MSRSPAVPSVPVLHDWYLAPDGCLHFTCSDGTVKRTTKVVAGTGQVATTESNRKYRLGKMHPHLVSGLNKLKDPSFDPAAPLEYPELLKQGWTASITGLGRRGSSDDASAASADAPSYSAHRRTPTSLSAPRRTEGRDHVPSPTVHADEVVAVAAPLPPPSRASGHSRRGVAASASASARRVHTSRVARPARGAVPDGDGGDDASTATPDDDDDDDDNDDDAAAAAAAGDGGSAAARGRRSASDFAAVSEDASPPAGSGSGSGAAAGGGGGLKSSRRQRGKPKRGVQFGNVHIAEFDRVRLDSPRTGTPRLGLGWNIQNHTLRRLDSLEAERSTTRVTKEHLQPLTPRERSRLVENARGLLADNLPTVAPDSGKTWDAELDDWHLGADGSVYHSGGITSKVGSVDGRVVTTSAFGSRYKLLTVKPVIEEVLDRLGIPFDPDNPLKNASSLVYAWTVHLSEPEMLQVRKLIADLQTKLMPFGTSVHECFTSIDVAVRTLGFPEPPTDGAGSSAGPPA